MKTVIIALPVPDDADIFEIAEIVNEAFPSASDADECVVFESAEALADDLGWIVGLPLAEDEDEECAGECIRRPHLWRYGADLQFVSPVCQRSGCNVMGTGDPCGDGNCEGA